MEVVEVMEVGLWRLLSMQKAPPLQKVPELQIGGGWRVSNLNASLLHSALDVCFWLLLKAGC